MAVTNRDKWCFHDEMPDRRPLSAEDVRYWTQALTKILKVGMEFEYNLPSNKKGSCRGDNTFCPCANLNQENDCWKQCINTGSCSSITQTLSDCVNVTANCVDEDCETCEHFLAKCTGIECPNFVAACLTCQEYNRDCKACEHLYDPSKSPDAIRRALGQTLKPNNSYGTVSESGVCSIVEDGSLLGGRGAEVITVGRRVDYWEFYKMAKKIIKESNSRGAYINERCSVHMHVLASYYSKVVQNADSHSIPQKVSEMERDMPEIIMANFHQLVRRYQNAMTWMTMALSDPKRLTRWEKFRVSVLPIGAAVNNMRKVVAEVSNHAGGSKYGWINYNRVGFSRKSSDISRFHIEFRAADGIMSPSAVAAIACMYHALAIKAVRISRYGVMEVGDAGWLDQAMMIKDAMLNNRGDWKSERFSNTENLHKYYDTLIAESLDLVRQLKSILMNTGPAYDVLEKLAEKPPALRLAEGQSWKEIEDDLAVIVTDEGRVEIALSEIVNLNQVSECDNIEEWIQVATQELRQRPDFEVNNDQAELEDQVHSFVVKNRDSGNLVWSTKIGAPIII